MRPTSPPLSTPYDPQGDQVAPTQTVHKRTLVVRNVGKETATHVEVIFSC